MSEDPGAVLITGCSSGIGHETARRLAARGWTVYATARRPEQIADLAAEGCETLALDVTDEGSMHAAVAAVEAEHGAVGALVNNAGYSQSGALETLPMERIRAQFETNVFGLVRMCQLALPAMRRAGRGTIVNISSMGGKLVFPGAAPTTRPSTRSRRCPTRCAWRSGLRGPGRDRRAGPDHDQLRRHGRRLDRGGRPPTARRPTTRTPRSTPPSARRRSGSTRGR